MLGSRSEWCISRQRVWGLPIPAFYHNETGTVHFLSCVSLWLTAFIGETLMTSDTVAHLQSLILKHPRGSDCWWELDVEALLPESVRHLGVYFILLLSSFLTFDNKQLHSIPRDKILWMCGLILALHGLVFFVQTTSSQLICISKAVINIVVGSNPLY